MALHVLRHMDQESCPGGGQSFPADFHNRFERLPGKGFQAPQGAVETLRELLKNGFPAALRFPFSRVCGPLPIAQGMAFGISEKTVEYMPAICRNWKPTEGK